MSNSRPPASRCKPPVRQSSNRCAVSRARFGFNEDRTAHVVPRFAGVAESVSANLGQVVAKGQVLAVIASTSLSEQRSELLTAQKRRELAKSTFEREKKLWQDRISAEQDYLQAQTALQEADISVQNASQKLSAVGAGSASKGGLNRSKSERPSRALSSRSTWHLERRSRRMPASLRSPTSAPSGRNSRSRRPAGLGRVRVGQRVIVSSTAFDSRVEGNIAYVGALIGEQTPHGRARA